MVRLKKNLNDEEVSEVLDKIKSRFTDLAVSPKNVRKIRLKLTGLLEIVKVVEAKKPKTKKSDFDKIKDVSYSSSKVEPANGEVIFSTLQELLENVRQQKEEFVEFRQYTNPISQLIGYATDDGSKYVINIVDLRKDARADSFTFNPMKLLEVKGE